MKTTREDAIEQALRGLLKVVGERSESYYDTLALAGRQALAMPNDRDGETLLKSRLREILSRVAATALVPVCNVQVYFDEMRDGPGEWTIEAQIPPKDKRKRYVDEIRGSGDTLVSAEATFVDRLARHRAFEALEATENAARRKRVKALKKS